MLKRIAIDNVRCFQNFTFEPDRINLLLGANGSGRSSFLDVLDALRTLIVDTRDPSEVFPTRWLTRWDQRDHQRIELDVDLDGARYAYLLVLEHDREHEQATVREERLQRDGAPLFTHADGVVRMHYRADTTFDFKGARSFLSLIDRRDETRAVTCFQDFLASLAIVRLQVRDVGGESGREAPVLARDGSNFASWYRHLSQEHPDRLPGLWSSLKAAVPGLEAMKLASAGGRGSRELVAAMSVGGRSYEIGFAELSDGQRALVVLYTLLAGIEPGRVLVLDEPELHVGLAEVQPWLVALDDHFQDRGQVFVVSQHPEVVDYLAAGHPFLFVRPDGGPTQVRHVDFDRDSGISASEQLARGLVRVA